MEQSKEEATPQADMSLLSITDGENARGIPVVKFIEDVEAFVQTFDPPASAELLIGAYSELHSKFKTFETTLTQKSKLWIRIPWLVLRYLILTATDCICRVELSGQNPRP